MRELSRWPRWHNGTLITGCLIEAGCQTLNSLSFSADLVWRVHVCMSAFSNTRGHLCVWHILLDGLREKERLLVV